MSYYMGDFYTGGRGDFYRGDPGFFSALRGIAGRVAGMIPGVGPIAQAAIGVGGTLATRGSSVTRVGSQAVAAIKGHPVLSAAGAAGVIGLAAGRAVAPSAMAGAPKGYHMSKPRKGHPSHLVKNRHMRVGNVRAIRRSLRRIHGFSRLARKVIHIAHPPRGARVRYKFRRKRKSV